MIMKVAISNIAWPADQDHVVADLLGRCAVCGLEIAPTKIWPSPLEATDFQIDSYRRFWEERGIQIVAAQALLFNRPDLSLFESREARQRTLDYLRGIVRLCARLGARALVFGSPKNRRLGDRDRAASWQEAIAFFGGLGEIAKAEGTTIGMEANPTEYGADFVTTAGEAVDLVEAVNHPGFRLHLDTACMTLAGDNPDTIIPAAASVLTHFHVSEPHLAPVGEGSVDHRRFAAQLGAIGYSKWASVEMKELSPFNPARLVQIIQQVQACYQ
jgi:sugar phosphate isomerase/epimerase